MIKESANKAIRSHTLRAIVLALVLLVGGELLLAWQYERLAKDRVQDLEERVEEQGQVLEERAAKDAAEGFLEARVSQDERKMSRYVTEELMLQRAQGLFELYGVQDYYIEKQEQLQEHAFRFHVAITRERLEQVEFIEVIKISNQYYVHSVELAG